MPETVIKYQCATCCRTFDTAYQARQHAMNHSLKPYQKLGADTGVRVREVEVEVTDFTEMTLSAYDYE